MATQMVVRLISQDRVQRLDPTPLSRPDRGRPTEIWLVGPCGSAIKRGGGRGTRYEVHRVASRPTDILTDLGLALVTGSTAAATTYPRPRHHPSPWPLARVPRAKVQVIPLSL
jgi:hypothetical protein